MNSVTFNQPHIMKKTLQFRKVGPSRSGFLAHLLFALLLFLCLNTSAQNNTGNSWQSWIPELSTGAQTDFAAFSINSVNNQLDNITATGTCESYGIGSDRRG